MIKDVFNDFIENWASKHAIYLKLGTVKSVNVSEKTFIFVPNTGDAEIDVYMSVFDGESYIVPKVGSVVLVGYSDNVNAYCIHVQQAETIVFNNGDNKGLINIESLTSKINGLISEIKTMKATLNTHTHMVASVGAPTATALPQISVNFTDLDKNDYEDTKILH